MDWCLCPWGEALAGTASSHGATSAHPTRSHSSVHQTLHQALPLRCLRGISVMYGTPCSSPVSSIVFGFCSPVWVCLSKVMFMLFFLSPKTCTSKCWRIGISNSWTFTPENCFGSVPILNVMLCHILCLESTRTHTLPCCLLTNKLCTPPPFLPRTHLIPQQISPLESMQNMPWCLWQKLKEEMDWLITVNNV